MFDYRSFGADRSSGRGNGNVATLQNQGKTPKLRIPEGVAAEMMDKLHSKRFDYAMDDDGNLYVFAGTLCRMSDAGRSKILSVGCIKRIADKVYGVGKIANMEHEWTYDASGTPAAVFMRIGA